MDSGSDDSHRWSDTLSIDEKDGFVFVNYSEGQTKGPHSAHSSQASVPQPLHPSTMEARTYNQLRAGGCFIQNDYSAVESDSMHEWEQSTDGVRWVKMLLVECLLFCFHRLQMGAPAGLPEQTHHAHSF